jgi:hypothetical protein
MLNGSKSTLSKTSGDEGKQLLIDAKQFMAKGDYSKAASNYAIFLNSAASFGLNHSSRLRIQSVLAECYLHMKEPARVLTVLTVADATVTIPSSLKCKVAILKAKAHIMQEEADLAMTTLQGAYYECEEWDLEWLKAGFMLATLGIQRKEHTFAKSILKNINEYLCMHAEQGVKQPELYYPYVIECDYHFSQIFLKEHEQASAKAKLAHACFTFINFRKQTPNVSALAIIGPVFIPVLSQYLKIIIESSRFNEADKSVSNLIKKHIDEKDEILQIEMMLLALIALHHLRYKKMDDNVKNVNLAKMVFVDLLSLYRRSSSSLTEAVKSVVAKLLPLFPDRAEDAFLNQKQVLMLELSKLQLADTAHSGLTGDSEESVVPTLCALFDEKLSLLEKAHTQPTKLEKTELDQNDLSTKLHGIV